MAFHDHINQQLSDLKDRRYVVERYTVSLRQLSMALYGMNDNIPPLYITFRTVKYLRIIPYWEQSPFVQGTSDECKRLLDENGIEIMSDMPVLYHAKLQKTVIQVVCHSVFLHNSLPD